MKTLLHGLIALAGMLALAQEADAAVIISSHATKNMSCTGGVCQPTAPTAWLNVGELTSMLAQENVTVQGNAVAPDIVSNATFRWSSGYGLTLAAAGNLTINHVITDGAGAPVWLTYNQTGGGGVLSFGAKGRLTFSTTSTQLSINGQSYVLVSNIATLAEFIANNPSGSFALAANYNARNDGTYSQSPIPTPFAGNFQGLGNSISNLKVESANTNPNYPIGFVQQTSPTAYWANLVIDKTTIEYQGSVIYALGGMVGWNQGTLWHDSFNGTVTITDTSCVNTGGLVGGNDGTIWYSSTSGSVSSTAGQGCAAVGGLVGWNAITTDAAIHNSSSSATVTGSGTSAAGGLAGAAGQSGVSVIESSSATGSVTLNGAVNCCGSPSAGGLVGADINGPSGGSSISASSATGSVSGGDGHNVGGLVGGNLFSDLSNFTAKGAVSGGLGCSCGGAIGADGSDGSHSVGSSDSYGTVTGGSGSVIGGFIGDDESNGEMSNDGWDETTSGITDPSQGAGNIPNDPGITGFN